MDFGNPSMETELPFVRMLRSVLEEKAKTDPEESSIEA
jgi:hypothetical protein